MPKHVGSFIRVSTVSSVQQFSIWHYFILVQYGAAASTFHSIGGVQFLSMLRQDITDKEHLEHIDNILNSLFWVHVDEEEQDPILSQSIQFQVTPHPTREDQGTATQIFATSSGGICNIWWKQAWHLLSLWLNNLFLFLYSHKIYN